jgi:hypothetical protein
VQPVPADLEVPAESVVGEHPSAEPLPRLEHHHVEPAPGQFAGSDEPGYATPDDDDVDFPVSAARHGPLLASRHVDLAEASEVRSLNEHCVHFLG